MLLRCTLDGLVLKGHLEGENLAAFDGDERFILDAVEAIYYRLQTATLAELLALPPRYRLLQRADDFRLD